MADNSRASLGTQDGDTFATDDIGGIKYPRSKIVIGADGTSDGDVSAANPLPVAATELPLPSNAAQEGGGNLAVVAALAVTPGTDRTDQVGVIVEAIVNDTPEAYTPGYVQPLSLTPEGRLRVSPVAPDALDARDFLGGNEVWGARSTFYLSPWKDIV